jgi:hypothetical protein
MILNSFFPAAYGQNMTDGLHEVVIGWELASLLTRELTLSNLSMDPSSSPENEAYLFAHLHQNRTTLTHAVSKWPTGVSLELHRATLPNLADRFRGSMHCYLLLRARAEGREQAMELALKHCTTLQALLNSCLPEAEFSFVDNADRLNVLCRPFEPGYAIMLGRASQHINLAEPMLNNPTGFNSEGTTAVADSRSLDVRYIYPWLAPRDSHERLVQFLLWQTYPVWIVVRMRATEHVEIEKERLLHGIEQCEAHLGGTVASRTVHTHQVRLLREQLFSRLVALNEGGLQLSVMVFSLDAPDPALPAMIGCSLSQMAGRDKSKGVLEGGFSHAPVELPDALNPWRFQDDETYTPEEAAAAFRLPTPPVKELPGIPVKRFRSAFAHVPHEFADLPDAVLLGVNAHRGIRQQIFCRVKDRMRHMFILGMTGTGKSAFMESLLMQDIHKGHGLCLVDPHGELIESVLPKIPAKREKDVIIVDPMDTEYPVGFNLLEWKTIEERDRIIDDLYLAMDRMYDMRASAGPIFENNYRNMLKLLMGDRPRPEFTPTIIEFPALYLHEDFRQWLVETMDDPQVKDFVAELERTRGETELRNLAPYITSKFNRFAGDSILKRMVGQEHTPFDFREIMDRGRIVFINLGKGRFGANVSGLLASQIVNRFKNAAMSRADVEEGRRRPFFLYVDEFQNLPQEDFTELLAEARKYRLGLVMANQFAGQLDRSYPGQQSTLSAVLGNVGVFVMFRLGVADAQLLNLIFHPTFSQRDLKELPNWQAYVQLHIEGKVLTPFNIETVLDQSHSSAKTAERLRQKCRKEYGRPAHVIDAQISKRRRFFSR